MSSSKTALAVSLSILAQGMCVLPSSGQAQSSPSMIFTGESRFDFFGWSVSEAGDIDKDGYAELIVGAPENNKGGLGTGRAYVFSGQTGALLYTFIGEATGAYTGDALGYSVSGAGDVDNDGYADLVVGAPNGGLVGSAAGRVYVYSGQTGARLHTFTGEAVNDFFGRSVSGAGDINNDGYADLIVGAASNDVAGALAGRAYVYSGQSGALLYTFTGEAAGDALGYSVSGAGDVNNDGCADLIVGAAFNGVGGDNAGRVYVYSGQSGALLLTCTGEAAGDQFGWSVSGAADINNDGSADVVVGAIWNDAGGETAGRAYVYSLDSCCTTPGDANGDEKVNIADVHFVISWLFAGGASPGCCAEGSANGDGRINIADVAYVISWLFTGGPVPVCSTAGMGC